MATRPVLLPLMLLGLLTLSFGRAEPQTPKPPLPSTPKTKPVPYGAMDHSDLINFMDGDYTIVGKKPDSQATYTGRLRFVGHGRKLDFTRTVGRHTARGTAVFDTVAGADRIPVLRLNFTQDGHAYAGTYQWSSDYDNYVRFTGYVYRPDGKTKSAGLETFFPVPPSVRD